MRNSSFVLKYTIIFYQIKYFQSTKTAVANNRKYALFFGYFAEYFLHIFLALQFFYIL